MGQIQDQVRFRLANSGAAEIDGAELLAVLLRTGSQEDDVLDFAQKLLEQSGGLRGLSRLNYSELAALDGMTPGKATTLAAAFEIGKRTAAARQQDAVIIRSAADVANICAPEMESLRQEHFRVVLLDMHRRVMGLPTVYIGSVGATVIRTAEVFRHAVIQNCASVVLVHNHPSGDPTPSTSDREITEALVAAGRALDIGVVDHVIIGQGRWVSMKEAGFEF